MKWLSGLYLTQASCSHSLFPSGLCLWVSFVWCFLGSLGLLSINWLWGSRDSMIKKRGLPTPFENVRSMLITVDAFPVFALNFWVWVVLMRLCFLPFETAFLGAFFFLIDTPFFLKRAMVLPVFEVTSRTTVRPQEGLLLNTDQFWNVRSSPFWEIQKNAKNTIKSSIQIRYR